MQKVQKQKTKKKGKRKKKISIVTHIRPLNALMVFVAVVLGGLVAGSGFGTFLLAGLSALLISGASQSINDYFDYEIDRKKKKAEKKRLLYFSAALYFSGILISFFASVYHFFAASLVSLLTYLYSWKMSGRKYFGNLVVSFCVAFSFVYGGITGVVEKTFLPAFLIFLTNWAREILKDVEDYEKDMGHKKTLPHIIGKKHSGIFSTYLILLALMLSPFLLPEPFGLGIFGWGFALPFLASAGVFILSGTYALKERYAEAQRACKVAMILALLAFGLGLI